MKNNRLEKQQQWDQRKLQLDHAANVAEVIFCAGLILGGIPTMVTILVIQQHILPQAVETMLLILSFCCMVVVLYRVLVPIVAVEEALDQLKIEQRHIHTDECTLQKDIVVLNREVDIGGFGFWGGANYHSILRWERTQCQECHTITLYEPKTGCRLETPLDS